MTTIPSVSNLSSYTSAILPSAIHDNKRILIIVIAALAALAAVLYYFFRHYQINVNIAPIHPQSPKREKQESDSLNPKKEVKPADLKDVPSSSPIESDPKEEDIEPQGMADSPLR